VTSAAKKRWYLKYNPTNNPVNNPIHSLKRKVDLQAANLQAVKDDSTILETQKMSAGTSALTMTCSD